MRTTKPNDDLDALWDSVPHTIDVRDHALDVLARLPRGLWPSDGQQQANPPERAPYLRSEEAIVYLGLDSLSRPDNALTRLIDKGDLKPKKIGRRYMFARDELDRLLEHGGRRSRRGRPRGARNKQYRQAG